MINPADVHRMVQRAHEKASAARESARNQADSPADTPLTVQRHFEIAYSSHYSSGFFMEDEEYRAEYDLELDSGADASSFSSISSAIVPLYTTSTQNFISSMAAAAQSSDAQSLHSTEDDATTTSCAQSEPSSDAVKTRSRRPAITPAIMAKKREDSPLTFASLDNRDLPVVREYSAGGLIFDDQDRVAIIARHSRSGHLEWCLPKGHIEKGETPAQTAVREIHEETGILGEVVDSIATIDYWFTGDAQRIHKLVHHYALRMTGGYLTVEGDPDHEAEDATWVKFEDLTDVLSYPNERRIVWLYAKKHRKDA
ncbi:NUDIX hydrolase [Alloscardovia macacae]|uniref:NUDIX domain-containing protein n=1 Tax=Alloscardovia macacae TaxID=1160091 RepID=A0A261F6E5_9BIFI|nr:NUDIX hydrolase [Alloscardovia macacae]OZG54719.1 NUDIX domain-containing protein [Alloscardovia macacae]